MTGRWDNCLIDQNCWQKFIKFFNLLFSYNFTKVKSFECPKPKPANNCFIFNLSKWYLVYETINPATQRIILKIIRFQKSKTDNRC